MRILFLIFFGLWFWDVVTVFPRVWLVVWNNCLNVLGRVFIYDCDFFYRINSLKKLFLLNMNKWANKTKSIMLKVNSSRGFTSFGSGSELYDP